MTEREPQEEEHDQRAGPSDVVEIVRKVLRQCTVHSCNIETVWKTRLDRIHIALVYIQNVDNIGLICSFNCGDILTQNKFSEY